MISTFNIVIQRELLSDCRFKNELERMFRFISYLQLLATTDQIESIREYVAMERLCDLDFLIDKSYVHPDDEYVFRMKEFLRNSCESNEFLRNCKLSREMIINLECGPSFGTRVICNFGTPRGHIATKRFDSSVINM